MVFSKTDRKMPMRRTPNEIFGVWEFFIESLSKNISRSGTPKIDDFGPFFKSMVEIYVKWEKACFLRPRFFRKIEEMGGFFGGCAPKTVPQVCTNVESFQRKNGRDQPQTRGVTGPNSAVCFLPEHGTTHLCPLVLTSAHCQTHRRSA